MATKLSTKQRLLKVREILEKYSDEEHQLTSRQILDYLDTEETVNTTTIKNDIKELIQSGLFDVEEFQEKNGVEKKYSYEDRLFGIHELRVLADALSSARFITNSETDKLIEKLKKLTSVHLAQQLENRIILAEGAKTENPGVKYAIHTLHSAIWEKKVIQFQYGRYNLDKEFVLSKDGGFYYVKPYALVWDDEFYYLIGEYELNKEIRHYRVDRMREVTTLDQTFLPDSGFDVSKYRNRLFNMWSGEVRNIEIEFDNDLINVVIDHFGVNIRITRHTEHTFRISIDAVLSDGLVYWLLSRGGKAKVLHPPSLVERMKEEAEKLWKQYQ